MMRSMCVLVAAAVLGTLCGCGSSTPPQAEPAELQRQVEENQKKVDQEELQHRKQTRQKP